MEGRAWHKKYCLDFAILGNSILNYDQKFDRSLVCKSTSFDVIVEERLFEMSRFLVSFLKNFLNPSYILYRRAQEA